MSGLTTIIGNRGEEAATEWLRQQGFYIVERNWRIGHYEMDIIAERYDTLHFIEVKSRHISGWESPYDSMTTAKMRSLRHAANSYCTIFRIRRNVQFDLIAVTIDDHDHCTIEYTENIM